MDVKKPDNKSIYLPTPISYDNREYRQISLQGHPFSPTSARNWHQTFFPSHIFGSHSRFALDEIHAEEVLTESYGYTLQASGILAQDQQNKKRRVRHALSSLDHAVRGAWLLFRHAEDGYYHETGRDLLPLLNGLSDALVAYQAYQQKCDAWTASLLSQSLYSIRSLPLLYKKETSDACQDTEAWHETEDSDDYLDDAVRRSCQEASGNWEPHPASFDAE